jgi:hypothetical protein
MTRSKWLAFAAVRSGIPPPPLTSGQVVPLIRRIMVRSACEGQAS